MSRQKLTPGLQYPRRGFFEQTQVSLAKRFDALGVKSTVNIARDYLDDLRMPVEKAPSAVPAPPPSFLPGAGLL